jgi:hypothetical protein
MSCNRGSMSRRLFLPALVGLAVVALNAPAGASAETFTSSGNGMNINDGTCSSDPSQHAKSTPYPLTIQVSASPGSCRTSTLR